MSKQIYFKIYQSKEKQIFWFRVSPLFYSWPLLNLAVCWKEKKNGNVLFLGFHHSAGELGGLLLQGLEKPWPLQ